ncbi:MAG: hypothetical protein KDB70_13320 [Mycobacterium sp.]|nr:hypothetical protein [Mycobacterium sp.]
MTSAVTPLVREITQRAERDPGFAEVLELLVDAPTRPDGTLERIAAANLNRTRRTALSEEFRDGALPTPAVQALLGLRTPQAVHRLRSRGKLVGAPIGNQTWFPAWQFDDDRIRPELPRILELLARFTGDAMTADRIMRITHDELGGSSISAALRRPDNAEAAWGLLAALGA